MLLNILSSILKGLHTCYYSHGYVHQKHDFSNPNTIKSIRPRFETKIQYRQVL